MTRDIPDHRRRVLENTAKPFAFSSSLQADIRSFFKDTCHEKQVEGYLTGIRPRNNGSRFANIVNLLARHADFYADADDPSDRSIKTMADNLRGRCHDEHKAYFDRPARARTTSR